tara:strand:- start:1004 stop:1927 length:924 start_codon:yes stop_codon:yes gene_type:complete
MKKYSIKTWDIFFVLLVIVLLVLNFYILSGDALFANSPGDIPNEGDKVVTIQKPDPFAYVRLSASSAVVYDISNKKVLFSKNEEEQAPLASVTKVMTAIAAREILPDDTVITIENDAIAIEGDSGLFLNEKWELPDLLALTLVSSSNDATRAIRRHVQTTQDVDMIGFMNDKAKELGLNNTFYINESGLDVNEKISGSYGSAEDVAKLISYGVKNHADIFAPSRDKDIVVTSLNYGDHEYTNTNAIIENIPSLLLSKTGLTDLAGGNLAIVFEKEPNYPIAVVILGSTQDDRFTDIEQLVWAAIETQ